VVLIVERPVTALARQHGEQEFLDVRFATKSLIYNWVKPQTFIPVENLHDKLTTQLE
jgi:hypothetical protein